MRGGFIWDDDLYVTDSQITKASNGLYRAWFTTELLDYWPATSTVLWLEWRLWGDHAAGYHMVNVLLHAANAILVWIILRRLKIAGAWLAGLVFAIHPVNVETAAWISEQKNTLSMLFYAVAIQLYLRFDEEERWHWYGLSLAAFLLALLSKTAVVMLPVVLLGCVWWQRAQIRQKDVVRSLPFFVLSLILGLVTIWLQFHGAMQGQTVRTGGFLSRLAAGGWAAWFYLYKAFLPVNLSVIYPNWDVDASPLVSYLPGIVMVGFLTILCWKRRSWGRPLLFGVGYFVVVLFPLLGFIENSYHRYSLVADRWQYAAIAGPIGLVVAAGATICRRMGERGKHVGIVASVGVLVVLGAATWRRSSVYASSESLWRDTVAKNPSAWVAHYNLANELSRTGRKQDAIIQYRQALQFKPDYEEARNNMVSALFQMGEVKEGIGQLEEMLRIRPDSVAGHYNLGNALLQIGRVKDAMAHYEQAVRLKPDFAEAHHAFGLLLAREGRMNDAISEVSQALRVRPDYPEAHQNLGVMLARQGKSDEAIPHLLTALQLNPDYAEAHYTVAVLLAKEGKVEEATSHLQSALKLEPGSEKFRRTLEELQRIRAPSATQ